MLLIEREAAAQVAQYKQALSILRGAIEGKLCRVGRVLYRYPACGAGGGENSFIWYYQGTCTPQADDETGVVSLQFSDVDEIENKQPKGRPPEEIVIGGASDLLALTIKKN